MHFLGRGPPPVQHLGLLRTSGGPRRCGAGRGPALCSVALCFADSLALLQRLHLSPLRKPPGPGLCAFCWAPCAIDCSAGDYSSLAILRLPGPTVRSLGHGAGCRGSEVTEPKVAGTGPRSQSRMAPGTSDSGSWGFASHDSPNSQPSLVPWQQEQGLEKVRYYSPVLSLHGWFAHRSPGPCKPGILSPHKATAQRGWGTSRRSCCLTPEPLRVPQSRAVSSRFHHLLLHPQGPQCPAHSFQAEF